MFGYKPKLGCYRGGAEKVGACGGMALRVRFCLETIILKTP